jgi:hypothetical protein
VCLGGYRRRHFHRSRSDDFRRLSASDSARVDDRRRQLRRIVSGRLVRRRIFRRRNFAGLGRIWRARRLGRDRMPRSRHGFGGHAPIQCKPRANSTGATPLSIDAIALLGCHRVGAGDDQHSSDVAIGSYGGRGSLGVALYQWSRDASDKRDPRADRPLQIAQSPYLHEPTVTSGGTATGESHVTVDPVSAPDCSTSPVGTVTVVHAPSAQIMYIDGLSLN